MRSLTWLACGTLAFFLAAPQMSTPGPKAGPASPLTVAGPAVFSAVAGENEADRVAIGQTVEVRPIAGKALAGASIVFVGPVADAKTGRVPVLVRVANPDEHLRCGVPLLVRFTTSQAVCKR
jgi:multidrug efflux pump subunit AcrA (membrane-fusion protein)